MAIAYYGANTITTYTVYITTLLNEWIEYDGRHTHWRNGCHVSSHHANMSYNTENTGGRREYAITGYYRFIITRQRYLVGTPGYSHGRYHCHNSIIIVETRYWAYHSIITTLTICRVGGVMKVVAEGRREWRWMALAESFATVIEW